MNKKLIAILLALHVLVFVYPVVRIGLWLDAPIWLLSVLTIPLFFSQLIARRILYRKGSPASALKTGLRTFIDYLLGVFSIGALVLLLTEPVFYSLDQHLLAIEKACIVLSLTAVFSLLGTYSAFRPATRKVSISSAKLSAPLRLVQLSDVHIGSRSVLFLRYLRWRVNRLKPDLVCITGDLIDQPGISAKQLADLARFHSPVFYVTGNHERYEDLQEIIARLKQLGVTVLENERKDSHGISIFGVNDADDPEQVKHGLSQLEVEPNNFNLLLYHKPVGIRDAFEKHIDLMLSGHTHGGQIWPFHLAVKKVFKHNKGLYHYKSTRLYVSEGTGTWGPTLRFFSKSEITLIELAPSATKAESSPA